jgi:hypothetical protein
VKLKNVRDNTMDTFGLDCPPGETVDVSHLHPWQVEWLKRHGMKSPAGRKAAPKLVRKTRAIED